MNINSYSSTGYLGEKYFYGYQCNSIHFPTAIEEARRFPGMMSDSLNSQ